MSQAGSNDSGGERTVEIWKSQPQRFPDSHRPGCYDFSSTIKQQNRAKVLPMSPV